MSEPNDTAKRRGIATRAIAAAAWSLALVALVWPLRLVNVRVLSRAGPYLFGYWTYLNMLLVLIPSLLVFGGPRVLVYFLPGCPGPSRRRLVLAFTALGVLGTFVGLGLVGLFPVLHGYLGIREHTRAVMIFLVTAVPLQVLNQVLTGALQGALRLADSEKARNIPNVITLVAVITVFLAAPEMAARNHVLWMMGIILGRLVLCLVWLTVLCVRTFGGPGDNTASWFPRGFWRYGGYLHLNQLVDFVYMHADEWIVLYFFHFEGLAGYRVARSLARMIGVIPTALRNIVFSMFCQLQSPDDSDRRRRAFRLSVLINSVPSITLALVLVCFSTEIVGFMNPDYLPEAARILLLLAATASVTGLGGVNASYIMGRGGSRYTFLVASVGGAVQLALTWLLLSNGEGTFGVALARVLGMVVMLTLTTWWVLRRLPGAIPSAYLVGATVVTATAVVTGTTELSLIVRTVILAVGAVGVVVVSVLQMERPFRRLLFSPWKLFQLVLAEGRMKAGRDVRDGE